MNLVGGRSGKSSREKAQGSREEEQRWYRKLEDKLKFRNKD